MIVIIYSNDVQITRFIGSPSPTLHVMHVLPVPVITDEVVLNPLDGVTSHTLRVELFGCRVNQVDATSNMICIKRCRCRNSR